MAEKVKVNNGDKVNVKSKLDRNFPTVEEVREMNKPKKSPFETDLERGIKIAKRNTLQFMKSRIAIGNRLSGTFRYELGLDPSEKMTDSQEEKILKAITNDYKLVSEAIANYYSGAFQNGIKKYWKEFPVREGLIRNESKFRMVKQYKTILEAEKEAGAEMGYLVNQHPLWEHFFSKIKGIGFVTAGDILGCSGRPDLSDTISAYWKYWGVGLINDPVSGQKVAQSRSNLFEEYYVDKDEKVDIKLTCGYNVDANSRLIGVIGDGLIKQTNGHYRQIYLNKKHYYQNSPNHSTKKKGHIHKMARRFMCKMFLHDCWIAWRKSLGLPLTESYSVRVLGFDKSHHTPSPANFVDEYVALKFKPRKVDLTAVVESDNMILDPKTNNYHRKYSDGNWYNLGYGING